MSDSTDELDERLRRLEWKVNVLIGLAVLGLAAPSVATVFAWLKWGLLIVPLIAVCVLGAIYHNQLPKLRSHVGRALGVAGTWLSSGGGKKKPAEKEPV